MWPYTRSPSSEGGDPLRRLSLRRVYAACRASPRSVHHPRPRAWAGGDARPNRLGLPRRRPVARLVASPGPVEGEARTDRRLPEADAAPRPRLRPLQDRRDDRLPGLRDPGEQLHLRSRGFPVGHGELTDARQHVPSQDVLLVGVVVRYLDERPRRESPRVHGQDASLATDPAVPAGRDARPAQDRRPEEGLVRPHSGRISASGVSGRWNATTIWNS